MTIEELKQEADKLGYRLYKKPNYDCSCWCDYPNIHHKKKNGEWKCIDRYELVRDNAEGRTRCKKKG